ncbi:PRC-barrel domain protein [Maritalea mobilis]|uniref:PRC-barrel domain protein n=1 Tax=Maritalea mobilis TaxID=483324 RepID=A0A4R6VW89_9HYPH|nr:PRC-barrel domain-containing protein [Maritalea mobilis]TDQ67086.1 PRC-barrel domain protein [Maritalea mobilis]
MSKKLFATTAIITLLSAPAFADSLNVGVDTNLDAGVETSSDENNDGLNVDLGAGVGVDAGVDTDENNTDGSVDAGVDATVDTSVDTDTSENGDTSADASVDGTVDLNNGEETSLSADLSAGAILATDLLGQEVHTSADADVQVVGDVNDVVMDDEGNADWVIVGVGGFLGLGEKEVAIAAEQVAWANIDNEQIVVTQMTQAELEAAEEFDRAAIEASGEYTVDDFSWTAEGEARLSAEQQ